MTALKFKGLHTHRLRDNPEEAKFAAAWDAECQHRILHYLLHTGDQGGQPPPDPSLRECEVAATVIQWLGSSVGQSFLENLGYTKSK